MGPEKAFLRARVTGRVQGVGYRYFIERVALDIGLVGYVMNRRDGSVEVVAEGEPEALRQLLGRLQEGPPGARVERVEEMWGSSTGRFAEFGIRFEE
jgi:acylphosphatase